jgi:pyruvate kinase
LIAKIENRDGVENLAEILDVSDGIMVARGDLGVSLPIYEIPILQKKIIKICGQKGKIAITATQMLESMTGNLRPTRAEVGDVANAVLDGSDYVMLSGETAIGEYPVETVSMMKKIIDYTVLHDI